MEYMEHYQDAATSIQNEIDELLVDDRFAFHTGIWLNIGNDSLMPSHLKRVDGAVVVGFCKPGNKDFGFKYEEIIGLGLWEQNILLDLLRIESKRQKENNKRLETGVSSLWVVDGDTHDTPALVESLTDIPLFFQSFEDYSIVPVNGNIDLFEDKDGQFVVYSEDYELAMWQIYANDELNILVK